MLKVLTNIIFNPIIFKVIGLLSVVSAIIIISLYFIKGEEYVDILLSKIEGKINGVLKNPLSDKYKMILTHIKVIITK